jgi:uncharacterized protein (DUF433 family)
MRIVMNAVSFDVENVIGRLDQLELQISQLRQLFVKAELPASMEIDATHPYVTRLPTILSGEPIIRGTRTPVRAIVEHWKFGDAVETIIHKLPICDLPMSLPP